MRELVFLQLNDLHGYLQPHPEWLWTANGRVYEEMGGLARIKTIVDEIRSRHQNVLFFDNGDTFHGTRTVVDTQGFCLLPMMQQLAPVAMTGHWDFAYGPEHLVRLTQALPYPFLAANVYEQDCHRLLFPPVLKLDCGATRVGVIGLACNIIDKVMPPHFSKGLYFTNGDEELPRYIEQLRQQEHCDTIVLLSHLGLPQDLDLLSRVPGVDVCLSSHTHNRLEKPIMVGKSVVIQSGCHGSFLGFLRIGLSNNSVSILEHKLIPVSKEIEPDGKMANAVSDALAAAAADVVAGQCNGALDRAEMLESSADNMLLDAMRSITGSELAFINGWRYGAPIPAGPITENAIYNLAPMNPEISTVLLTGQEVWEMLEENLERTFSRSPFDQMGGYVKRCAGLRVYFKVENPRGTRIQAIFIGDAPIDGEKAYTASFVTMQAVPEKYGTQRIATGHKLVEATLQFLQGNTPDAIRQSTFTEV